MAHGGCELREDRVEWLSGNDGGPLNGDPPNPDAIDGAHDPPPNVDVASTTGAFATCRATNHTWASIQAAASSSVHVTARPQKAADSESNDRNAAACLVKDSGY
jgi:hypothetical protein